MEENQFYPQTGQLFEQQPLHPKYAVMRKVFTATPTERLVALLSYPAAFLYACAALSEGKSAHILLAVFTVIFCLGVEYTYRKVRANWERWVWLAALILCLVPPLWGGNKVWEGRSILFVHGFAIYYTLCRAGVLTEGRTSHLLPADAFFGTFLYPLSNLFLRFRVLGTFPRKREKASGMTILWSCLAILAAAAAFIAAYVLLTEADTGFANLMNSLFRMDTVEAGPFLLRLLISLPIGAYVYGLVAGVGRESVQMVRERGSRICDSLVRMRTVPVMVWIILLAIFALFYGVFFFVQGQYLFGAFTRTLPKDFTVAEYARQGFFELCKVMVLNFALLWLALRSAQTSPKAHTALRVLATVVLAESLLLAVTAGSKLWLYIDCFGFTPLRLQSAWLIVSLGVGVICTICTLWTGRRSVRVWAVFSGLSLALLHLV